MSLKVALLALVAGITMNGFAADNSVQLSGNEAIFVKGMRESTAKKIPVNATIDNLPAFGLSASILQDALKAAANASSNQVDMTAEDVSFAKALHQSAASRIPLNSDVYKDIPAFGVSNGALLDALKAQNDAKLANTGLSLADMAFIKALYRSAGRKIPLNANVDNLPAFGVVESALQDGLKAAEAFQ